MSSRAPVRTAITLSTTPSAKRSQKLPPGLKASFKRAATAVVAGESQLEELQLSVVLVSDDELLDLNKTSLGHDWYTDIITFELDREEKSLESEIYLSVDRAAENAPKAGVSLENELIHLVIHGMLHLVGFDDHDPVEKKRMRQRERFYLAQI